MTRLTSERCNGIKTGYWSSAKKDELIQRLGRYEDTGLEPEEIRKAFGWISAEKSLPEQFVSVLGHMTDAGDFPETRECYMTGNTFFFPALNEYHPVDYWMPMPSFPKGGKV